MEARFRRDGRGRAGTLVEILDAHSGLCLAMQEESSREDQDPDAQLVREMFPGAELPRPIHKKRMRHEAVIADLLLRIGKPVAYFDPTPGSDFDYRVYWIDDEGGLKGEHRTACDLLNHGEVACALDLAPDGTPLEPPTDDRPRPAHQR